MYIKTLGNFGDSDFIFGVFTAYFGIAKCMEEKRVLKLSI